MGRGPSYPYVDLEQAIGLSKKIYDYAKRGAAPTEAVISEALKYSPTSSGSQKVLAALRAFGLVEDGPGTNGKSSIKVTPRTIRILLDEPDSAERLEEIKKAALSPKWYDYCWKKWGADMPPAMKSNLLIEHGFVDSTVDGFLRDYRKSIAFAGLLDGKIFEKPEESSLESTKTALKVGDYVQWETQGCLRLPKPSRIKVFLDDGRYATVEGWDSNPLPVAELIPVEPPKEPERPAVQPQNIFTIPEIKTSALEGAKMQNDVIASGGITLQIQWPTEITQEAYDDLIDYLAILQKRAKRAIKSKEAAESEVTSKGES